jgi:hypothetical protein
MHAQTRARFPPHIGRAIPVVYPTGRVLGHGDTHVIPGLRDALLDAAYRQAAAFCGDVGSAINRAAPPSVWFDALRQVPPIAFVQRLLTMNTVWGLADCASFAVHVREEGGTWLAVDDVMRDDL